jgi:hypothetical protein
MTMALERRIRGAALLMIAGLVTEMASLMWRHPTAFVLFVGLGGLLLAAGMLLFMWSIVSKGG